MPRPGMPAQELRSYSLSNRDPVMTVEQRHDTPGAISGRKPREPAGQWVGGAGP